MQVKMRQDIIIKYFVELKINLKILNTLSLVFIKTLLLMQIS